MKRIFGILMIILVAVGSQANTLFNDPVSESGIEIYPTTVSNELNIDVDDKLAETTVTVSVFNSVGEIVLQETLGLGLNKVDVSKLPHGNYVAVVRENDEYKSKSNFEVV